MFTTRDDQKSAVELLALWEHYVGGAPTDAFIDQIVFQYVLAVHAAAAGDETMVRALTDDVEVGLGIARAHFGFMAWARDGFPTYRLGAKLLDRLFAVDRGAEPLQAFAFPTPSFRVVLPGPDYAFKHILPNGTPTPVGAMHVYCAMGPKHGSDERRLIRTVVEAANVWDAASRALPEPTSRDEAHARTRDLLQTLTAAGDEASRDVASGRHLTLRMEPTSRAGGSGLIETFFLDGDEPTIGARFAALRALRNARADAAHKAGHATLESLALNCEQAPRAWALVVALAAHLTGREQPGVPVRAPAITIPGRRVPVHQKVWCLT